MGKQPPLPGSRAKDVMCKRWDTPQILPTFPFPRVVGIFPHSDIQHPMDPSFYFPVSTNHPI
jgi:hypothetical protein